MKWITGFLFAALVALCGFSVLAQDKFDKGITEYKFDDENVLGGLIGPGGDVLMARQQGKQRSLIKIRKHFVPEVFKSVEDI